MITFFLIQQILGPNRTDIIKLKYMIISVNY